MKICEMGTCVVKTCVVKTCVVKPWQSGVIWWNKAWCIHKTTPGSVVCSEDCWSVGVKYCRVKTLALPIGQLVGVKSGSVKTWTV